MGEDEREDWGLRRELAVLSLFLAWLPDERKRKEKTWRGRLCSVLPSICVSTQETWGRKGERREANGRLDCRRSFIPSLLSSLFSSLSILLFLHFLPDIFHLAEAGQPVESGCVVRRGGGKRPTRFLDL